MAEPTPAEEPAVPSAPAPSSSITFAHLYKRPKSNNMTVVSSISDLVQKEVDLYFNSGTDEPEVNVIKYWIDAEQVGGCSMSV